MTDDSTIRSAMTEALHAGIAPIPIGANKRPAVRWADYIERLPDLAELHSWPATSGYGIVCGGPSRLLVLDIEARFMDRLGDLSVALESAGMLRTFETWLEGYSVATPGGGMHVAIHLGGDDPVPGNEKLAMLDGLVAVETRGQGGYVVGPGSNGDTHPSGGTWTQIGGGFETIAWTTVAEWELVRRILVGFNVAPVLPSPPAVRAPAPRTASWIDAALEAYPSIESVLQDHGWVPARSSDQYGQHWVRPGKQPREGHSASLSANSRLYVHSTNAGLPVGNPTLDALDVELAYRLGRRPTPDERVAELRRWSPATATVQASARSTTGEVGSPPAMDTSVYLPDDFWQATPWLMALRDAALSRRIAPETVLGAFLSAYSATIPMGFKVPAIVAAPAPLNYYTCLVGPSGTGKTAAASIAADLLGFSRTMFPHVLLNQSLRSGEGLVSLAVIPSKSKRDEVDMGPAYRNGIQIVFDEGEGAARQAERLGSSTLSYLCSAWSGPRSMIGGAKAAGVEGFPADLVRVSLQMGTQPGVAGALFTGEAAAQGFPQRFVFFPTDNPAVRSLSKEPRPLVPIEPLDVRMWPHSEFGAHPVELGFSDDVQREIIHRHDDRFEGKMDDPLDGHRGNLQLRTAGLLALARGSVTVSESDWFSSSLLLEASCAVRRQLVSSIGNLSAVKARAAGELDAVRAEGRDSRWARGKAERLTRWMASVEQEHFSRKELKTRFNPTERKRLDEILDDARARGWVVHRGDGYIVGPSWVSN